MSLRKKLAAAFPSPAVVVGSACAALSLLLASLLWERAGNPVVVLVWLAAAAGLAVYSRIHRRWLAAFARIAAQRPHTTLRNIDGKWDGRSEEVAFVEAPRGDEENGRLITSVGMAA